MNEVTHAPQASIYRMSQPPPTGRAASHSTGCISRTQESQCLPQEPVWGAVGHPPAWGAGGHKRPQEPCLAPSPESRRRGRKGLWADQTEWAGAWEWTWVLGTPGRSVTTVDTQEPWKGPQRSTSFAIPMSIKDLLVFSRKLLEGIVQVSVQVCVCNHQCFKWEQWATEKPVKQARSRLSHVSLTSRSCLTLGFFPSLAILKRNKTKCLNKRNKI